MLEFMILKAVMKARTQDFSCRQNQFHIKLPLEARELIRASQTAVTICTKYKKKSSEGWKNRQAWQTASLLQRELLI